MQVVEEEIIITDNEKGIKALAKKALKSKQNIEDLQNYLADRARHIKNLNKKDRYPKQGR